jgi:hypothetical protein
VRVRAPWTAETFAEGERELWDRLMSWSTPGPASLVWIVSPDQRIREPIRYMEDGRIVTPGQLEERIRAICRRHGLGWR